jgi:hypothetical protein
MILTLKSDNPINCQASVSKSVIKIRISGCVYGLKDFSFLKFDKQSPVASVVATEKENGSRLELIITMKGQVDESPLIKNKGTDTYVLLSKISGESFNWKAASVLNVQDRPSEQTARGQTIVSEKKAIANNSVRTDSTYKLLDISMIYREQVCRINLKFNGCVKGRIYRNRDSLVCIFANTRNGLEKNIFDLTPSTVYRKIVLSEKVTDRCLVASIHIDTTAYQSFVNMIYEDSSLFTIMALNKKSSYNAFWSAQTGIEWEHELPFVAPYEIDLQKMGKRAEKDVAVNLTSGPVFRVGEFLSEVPSTEPKQMDVSREQTPKDALDTTIAKPQISEIAQTIVEKTPETEMKSVQVDSVIITADDVNIRQQPSVKSLAIAKGMKGMVVIRIESRENWTNIALNGTPGWVNSKFIEKPVTIVDEKPSLPDQTVLAEQLPGQRGDRQLELNSELYKVSNDSIAIQKVSQQIADDIIFRDENDGIDKVIRYNQQGRDPFKPLCRDSLVRSGKAAIDQLLLVGVLIDGNEKVALLEDKENKKCAFTLRESDAVENGKVLKIFPDRVVFLLTEFGISRSFTLHFKNQDTDQEVRVR